MNEDNIKNIIKNQREFFATGKTLSVSFRIAALNKLKAAMENHKDDILDALKEDLGKGEQEAFMCEYGLALSELSYMKKHVKGYAKTKRRFTPLTNFAARSLVKPVPYGNVLIMSPWNYPVLLTIEPLVDAIAAGNTALVKPSAYSPNVSHALACVIKEAFNEEYVALVEGGRAENKFLLDEKFDYIFFTGSKAVGKEVMAKAAKYLTPVTLELGGKSPCIINSDANLKLAAKRLVFGKYLNCGQTCVAPDYILCHKDIKDRFIEAVKLEIKKQYGESPIDNNADYGKIISKKHFDRLCQLIDDKKVVYGGRVNEAKLQIEPTVIDNVSEEDDIMQQEIFGPLMPVLTFETIDEVISFVNERPHPLAFYIFTSNKKLANMMIERCAFGGGCINDTIMHMTSSNMGFGGVGESGMGSYHGIDGFRSFSHYKSIADKKNWIDVFMRYQPYSDFKIKMIEFFLK